MRSGRSVDSSTEGSGLGVIWRNDLTEKRVSESDLPRCKFRSFLLWDRVVPTSRNFSYRQTREVEFADRGILKIADGRNFTCDRSKLIRYVRRSFFYER